MQSQLESIIRKGNEIDHDLVNDLLSGGKVVNALTRADADIIEDAINAKFRKKIEQIQDGFFQLGELDKKYPPKIPTNCVHFRFGVDWNTTFFINFWIGHKKYTDSSDDTMNEIVIYWENGTDKGNAYGTSIPDITRRYKIKSLAKSVKTLETVLDRFIALKPPLIEAYTKKVIFEKEQKTILKRNELQKDFKKHHDNYGVLKSLASEYGVTYDSTNLLADRIILQGKVEFKRILKLGEVAWIAPNGKKYKDLGMFL